MTATTSKSKKKEDAPTLVFDFDVDSLEKGGRDSLLDPDDTQEDYYIKEKTAKDIAVVQDGGAGQRDFLRQGSHP